MTDDIDIGETEHLFLPWNHNDNGLITGTPDDPETEDYPHIADLAQEPGIEGPGDKFRADFIVQACNAHHTLIETLKFLAGHAHMAATNYGSNDSDSLTNRNRALDNISKRALDAIKKAAP